MDVVASEGSPNRRHHRRHAARRPRSAAAARADHFRDIAAAAHLGPGDVILAAHGNFGGARLQDVFTPSTTLPSGDSTSGLSTGRVTFDLDNHTQWKLPHMAFLLDLGEGDSSNLVNRPVTRDDTLLGPLEHFQAGMLVPLPLPLVRRSSFQTIAYEQLPLGDNKLYSTPTRPGYRSLQIPACARYSRC